MCYLERRSSTTANWENLCYLFLFITAFNYNGENIEFDYYAKISKLVIDDLEMNNKNILKVNWFWEKKGFHPIQNNKTLAIVFYLQRHLNRTAKKNILTFWDNSLTKFVYNGAALNIISLYFLKINYSFFSNHILTSAPSPFFWITNIRLLILMSNCNLYIPQ